MTRTRSSSVHWFVLMVSAVLEAVWATALGWSEGFTVLTPTIVFLVAATLSMFGLGYAMKQIPVSVAYAVWTGLGAALTATISIAMGHEPFSFLKVLFLGGIVGCVVGLKFAPAPKPQLEKLRERSETSSGL